VDTDLSHNCASHPACTAIPGKEATDVAPAILSHFYTFGVPKILLTDGGREFRNSLQKQIWEALSIRHDVTTPYHPQCNAQVEVWNKTLKHYLATAIIDTEKSTL
jgi:transposase InsO family protein